MFRKIIYTLLVLSPLWISLFIGYPVISKKDFLFKQKENPTISFSKRCFAVGDFHELTSCFGNSERIQGAQFLREVFIKTNEISPVITVLFIISILVFVGISIAILIR